MILIRLWEKKWQNCCYILTITENQSKSQTLAKLGEVFIGSVDFYKCFTYFPIIDYCRLTKGMIQFILHHSFILFSSRLTKGMFQIFIHHLFVFHTLHYYCKRKSLIFSSYFCCSPKLDYLCMWKGAIHLRLHLLSWHFCLYFLFSLYVLHVHISVAEEMLPHIPSCTIFIKF